MKKKIFKIIITLVSIFIFFFLASIMVIPNLNENQTLYLSSTLAQVSATLFAITIAGYTFLEGKLEEDVKKDDTLTEIVFDLKSSYRHILLFGSIVTGLALFFCVANILIGDIGTIQDPFYKAFSYILNCSYIFSATSIASTLLFTYKATDPNRIKKASKKAIKESAFTTNTNSSIQEKNCFAEFMRTYNKLERAINNYVKDKKAIIHDYNGISLFKDLNYLKNSGLISGDIFNELHQLRIFRNYLVHGDSMFVNQSTLDNLEKLFAEINNLLSTNAEIEK